MRGGGVFKSFNFVFSLSKEGKYVPSGSALFLLQSSKCCLPGSWP